MQSLKTLDTGKVAQDLQLRKVQVDGVVELLDAGNTIPFITRYRKEKTGGLDEEIIREIQVRVKLLRQLADRKQTILKSIENQGKLNDALRHEIVNADTNKRLEDLYLPFKPKKRTLATAARERGLEPLALAVWNRDPAVSSLAEVLPTMVNPDNELPSVEDVKSGVQHILAEMISDIADVRAAVRFAMWETGKFTSTKSEKLRSGRANTYRDYFKYSESLRRIPPHRILALNRGDREGALKVKMEWNADLLRNRALAELAEYCLRQAQSGAVPQPSAHVSFGGASAVSQPAPPAQQTDSATLEIHATEPAPAEAAAVPESEGNSDVQPDLAEETPGSISGEENQTEQGADESSQSAEKEQPSTGPAPGPSPSSSALPTVTPTDEGEQLSPHSEFRTPHAQFLREVFDDTLNRLVVPSIEREIRRELMEEAQAHAITVFARNMRNLLLQRPVHRRRVLAVDPGFASGCKIAALDEYGNLLDHAVVYPHPVIKKEKDRRKKKETEKPSAKAAPPASPETTEPALAASGETLEAASPNVTETSEATPPDPAETPEANQQPSDSASPSSTAENTVAEGSCAAEGTASQPSSTHSDSASSNGGNNNETIASSSETAADSLSETVPVNQQAVTCEAAVGEKPGAATPLEQTTPQAPTPPGESPGASDVADETSPESTTPPAAKEDETITQEQINAVRRMEATSKIEELIGRHKLDLVAIGNGTACRETEEFVAELISEKMPQLSYVIVNEAGASVYSASTVGREEFPDYDATLRGTISIGRRLQDPLAELVKIDPQHIGVGLYQHDVNPKQLQESLEGVVESCVNQVGVMLNTASVPLLRYVSGLNQLSAREIAEYRKKNGPFKQRQQLLEVSGIGENRFVQAAGFLKIHDGDNPLDMTWIHPESYGVATQLITQLGYGLDVIQDVGRREEFHSKLRALNPAELAQQLQAGEPTIRDIIGSLLRPGHDPREDLPLPVFRKGVLNLEDLQEGMELKGTVLNVVDFGAFVDIGLKESGLVHISQLTNRFVKVPYEVIAVGDVVTVWVMKVDLERKHVSLTMVKPGTPRIDDRRGGRGQSGERPSRSRRGRGDGERSRRSDQAPPREGGQAKKGGRRRYESPRSPGKDRPKEHAPPRDPTGARPVFTRPAKPRRDTPKPKLSQEALEGKEPLKTFGQLSALFAAKDKKSEPPPKPAPQAESHSVVTEGAAPNIPAPTAAEEDRADLAATPAEAGPSESPSPTSTPPEETPSPETASAEAGPSESSSPTSTPPGETPSPEAGDDSEPSGEAQQSKCEHAEDSSANSDYGPSSGSSGEAEPIVADQNRQSEAPPLSADQVSNDGESPAQENGSVDSEASRQSASDVPANST